ncbi:MAG: hypothetical protein Q9213_007021 [Squamulea squamosa]
MHSMAEPLSGIAALKVVTVGTTPVEQELLIAGQALLFWRYGMLVPALNKGLLETVPVHL